MSRQSGFTLLESLIVLGILTVMVFVIFALAIRKEAPLTAPPASADSSEAVSVGLPAK